MTTLIKRKKEDILPMFKRNFLNTRLLGNDILDLENDFWNGSATVPLANISETKNEFRVDLCIPGFKRDDFKVEIENGILSVSSEKKEETKDENETYSRREFSYSSFTRTFELPENVLEDKINAKYDNGMLHIAIPKKEVSITKPKKAIQVA